MGHGQILHVDVVADAGTVGSVVVRSEHFEDRPPAARGLDREGNEVALGPVVLAQIALLVGTCGVEVAEVDVANPVCQLEVTEHAFEDELGAAIGIDGVLRVLLVDGNAKRIPERGTAGRKEDRGNSVSRHGREKVEPPGHIDPVVRSRIAHRLSHVGFGAEMKHGVEGLAREQGVENVAYGRLAQIGAHELGAPHGRHVPGAQIVEDDDALVAFEEITNDVGADVARAAGNEERPHLSRSPQPRPMP